MNEITIFPLAKKPKYIDTCVAWSYGEWICQDEEMLSLEQLKEFMMSSISDDELPIAYIAFYDGKIAGMATLKETEHEDRKDLMPWLGGVFVHPFFRRKGIGHSLCKQIARIAKNDFGYDKIHLQTASPDFYKPMGYKKIGMVKDDCGHLAEGQTLMVKPLE